jgi:DNA-binding MarR family transcriptional regulator
MPFTPIVDSVNGPMRAQSTHTTSTLTPAEVRAVATQCTCLNLRRITRKVTQRFDEWLAPAGLRCTQFSLLGMLHAPDRLTVSALAQKLDVDRTTLTRNLRLLTDRGLVAVVDGPDARSRSVIVTAQGRQAFARALPLWRKAQEEVNARLGDGAVTRLHDVLHRSMRRLSRE